MTLTSEEVDELLKPDYYIAYPISIFQKHFILKRVGECLRPPEPMEIANDVAQARKEREVLKQALEEASRAIYDEKDGKAFQIINKALASINKDSEHE